MRARVTVTPSTLLCYFFGSRKAIIAIARAPFAFWLAVLFVISAGLAREYDGADLIAEPWRILRPLAASLVSGTLLFLLAYGFSRVARRRAPNPAPRFLGAWLAFMTLFLMTAPMAWLYAIPYERFLSAYDATVANLITLAVVAGWRVLLMIRVVRVMFAMRVCGAVFVVMLFADAVALLALAISPTPVFDVMMGHRFSPRDTLLADVTQLVELYGVLTAPLWLIGALTAALCLFMRSKWPKAPWGRSGGRPSRATWVIGATVIAVFATAAMVVRPEQLNRKEAERLLRAGQVSAAITFMSTRERGDFPPHWDPPPRLVFAEQNPPLSAVFAAMRAHPPADWVREVYDQKFYLRSYTISQSFTAEDRAKFMVMAVRDVDHPWTIQVMLPDPNGPPGDANGINLAVATGAGRTPLGEAAALNRADAVGWLLKAGADIEAAGGVEGLASPAHLAAFHGANDALALLLDKGADPRVRSDRHGSLLGAAAMGGHRETIEMLLRRIGGGEALAGRATDGATPLHFAYRLGDQKMIALLLNAGADAEARTTDGARPRDWARD